jgi:exodeoxyribonuclease VII small subunit
MTSTTFKDSYGILQKHSQTLRTQQEPNIDDLLTIVTESVSAYKDCRSRIDAVEKALEKALSDTGSAPRDAKTSTPVQAMPPDSDDIPF